jgi:NAD(P)-dependent dehydrogenase (short-subunit alcohol dehydrogenase family)
MRERAWLRLAGPRQVCQQDLAFRMVGVGLELGPDKIRVNVICPGAISTEIADNTNVENDDVKIPVEYPEGNIPLTGGKAGSAEQVGELIAFLASDAASHISGTEIWIDGAQSLLQG